jgi:tetratricopeptide (TPR) repeat protein
MASDRGIARAKNRKRRAGWFVVSLVLVAVGGSAFRLLWKGNSPKQPQRLDLLYAAWKEFNAKSYDRASALLDRRAKEHEPTALDRMLRARIAESRGRLVEALDHLRLIPDSDPIASNAWLKVGQIELARHNARGAEAALLRSVALSADQIQAYRELAYLYAVQRRREDCDAQFRALAKRVHFDYVLAFAWCQNYCRLWDPKEARTALSGFVEYDPDDRPSRLALATTLRLTGQLDQAEEALRRLPDSDQDARALRVELLLDRGEIDAARALLDDGRSDHARLNAIRGRMALAAKDAASAVDYFRAALRQSPEDIDSIRGLGVALRLQGDPRATELIEAARRYENYSFALQNSSASIYTDPKLYYKLGGHCESLHCTMEARVWYELSVKRDPLDEQAREALSRLDQADPAQTSAAVDYQPSEGAR